MSTGSYHQSISNGCDPKSSENRNVRWCGFAQCCWPCAVVTPRVSLGQNNSPFPPCCCISKLTEFSQNTSEPARVWTKQPHLLKLCPSPLPWSCFAVLSAGWGMGCWCVFHKARLECQLRGAIVMSCFVSGGRPGCHTPFPPPPSGA